MRLGLLFLSGIPFLSVGAPSLVFRFSMVSSFDSVESLSFPVYCFILVSNSYLSVSTPY
jgi:hypothetical protein